MGFGQLRIHERKHHQTKRATDVEEQVPVGVCKDREERGRHGADVVAGHGDGRGVRTGIGRRGFLHHGDGHRHAGAHAQARDEAHGCQEGDGRHQWEEDGEDGENQHADHQRNAATKAVGDRTDQHSTGTDAYQRDGGDEGCVNCRDSGVRRINQLRNRGGQGNDVEAFEHDREPAQGNDPFIAGGIHEEWETLGR